MADEITKAELQLLIEVQTKSAQQMERVANQLTTIAEEQKTISKALSNGLGKKIIDDIKDACKPVEKKIYGIASDVLWTKIIVGSVSLVVAIALTILHFLGK